jgi:hypothetical protein
MGRETERERKKMVYFVGLGERKEQERSLR